jgi:hypothetical protein
MENGAFKNTNKYAHMRILKIQIKNKTSHSDSISFILLVKIVVHLKKI